MGHTSALDAFLNLHKDQLLLSNIPELYWSTLHEKLLNQTFDAGSTFQLLQIDYDREREKHEPVWGLQSISAIEKSSPQHIYLIDHAWTFRVNTAISQLEEFDSLRERLCNILGLKQDCTKTVIVEEIFNNVWKICNTYSIGNAENVEDRLPVWYVMDEIGSALMHSDRPNCRVVPFFYNNEQLAYSLLFPVENIKVNSLIYCDFAYGIQDKIQRAAALLPWVPSSFDNISIKPNSPSPEYYLSGHIAESLPLPVKSTKQIEVKKENLKVFTEYSLIKLFLTDNRFGFVDNEEEADILWYTKHFKNFAELNETPEKFVNQFPYEYVITVKDLLCLICRKTINSLKWLPVTYNLKTEIGNFVSYFQKRDKDGLDNYWIIKPYNLARSLDTHITNNLSYIMRLPATGPKICQKYITKPVLFYRPECAGSVKFDIRYVILLKSIEPLTVYVYKQFFLRFANQPFELNNFHVYEKHFTVMNYDDNARLKHMLCDEFKVQWKELYPDYSWNAVEALILKMLKEILECACLNEPPCGIVPNDQSRALYAADIMLEWGKNQEIQPKILEVNWTPDCQRACEYYPNFYNDIFRLLFLNEESDSFFKL